MIYIIAGIFGGIVYIILLSFLLHKLISIFLYPYFSNSGIPKEIDELTEEVRELRKTIAERSEE